MTQIDPTIDYAGRIEEVIDLVEGARSMPMSGSCVLNRSELLGLLDDLLGDLPGELRHARALVDERDGMIEVAQRKAEQIIAAAQDEARRIVEDGEADRDRLVSESHVVVAAERAAADHLADAEREVAGMLADAEADVERMRDEVDEYLGRTLEQFERLLNHSLQTVERGREKLRAREWGLPPEREAVR